MKELMYALKRLVSKRREISLIEIRKYDNEYEEAMDRVVEFERQYEEMELQPEDKAAIDGLLNAIDDIQECEVNLAYLVGIADSFLILDRLDLIQS